ncbi:MAG TPA: 6-phosphofructokinase [Anaerolineales bacterium]|nr:6-phosphofructokinase [Anaerolineales bacterium]
MSKRVAILTGGGDVPGLNMCLKSLVYRLIDLGYEPIGVRKGWEGLVRYNPQNPSTYSEQFIELTKNVVRPIDRTSGSFLHSSRLDPRRIPDETVPDFLRQPGSGDLDLTEHVLHVIQRLDFRGLIVIGDDDALQYAAYLSSKGVPVIGIPKTIHNNIFGTDYTLGFSTGLARGVAFIHELRALAGSFEKIIVVESFAAKSGYSTLLMAMLAGVDRVLIPEVPYDADLLAQLVLQDKRETPANYAVVLICDGAHLSPQQESKYAQVLSFSGKSGLLSSGIVASNVLTEITCERVYLQHLTYLLRTGSPDGQDLLGATNFAFWAAHLLHEGRFGRMTAFVKDRMWTDVELNLAIQGNRQVDVASMYDAEQYKPNLSLIWSLENL